MFRDVDSFFFIPKRDHETAITGDAPSPSAKTDPQQFNPNYYPGQPPHSYFGTSPFSPAGYAAPSFSVGVAPYTSTGAMGSTPYPPTGAPQTPYPPIEAMGSGPYSPDGAMGSVPYAPAGALGAYPPSGDMGSAPPYHTPEKGVAAYPSPAPFSCNESSAPPSYDEAQRIL